MSINQKGFSLIELLVSLMIFSVAMLGITPLLISAIKKNHANRIRSDARIVLENTATTLMVLNYDHPALGKMVPNWISGLGGCNPGISLTDNVTYNFFLEGDTCFTDTDNDSINNFIDPYVTLPKSYDLNGNDIVSITEIYDVGVNAMDHPGNRANAQYYNTDNDTARWHTDSDTCEGFCNNPDCCIYFPAVNFTATGLYLNAINLKETVQGIDFYKAWSVAVLDRFDTKVIGVVVYWWYPAMNMNELEKNFHSINTIVEKSQNY